MIPRLHAGPLMKQYRTYMCCASSYKKAFPVHFSDRFLKCANANASIDLVKPTFQDLSRKIIKGF